MADVSHLKFLCAAVLGCVAFCKHGSCWPNIATHAVCIEQRVPHPPDCPGSAAGVDLCRQSLRLPACEQQTRWVAQEVQSCEAKAVRPWEPAAGADMAHCCLLQSGQHGTDNMSGPCMVCAQSGLGILASTLYAGPRDTPRISVNDLPAKLAAIPLWNANDHSTAISRTFVAKNFMAGVLCSMSWSWLQPHHGLVLLGPA